MLRPQPGSIGAATIVRLAVTGLLVVTVVPACEGPPGSDGLRALIRQQALPCGDDCPFGGVVLESGLDVSDDGVLDDAEVTASNLVCSACANEVVGDVRLVSAADAAGLRALCGVRGTLRVDADFDAAELPELACLGYVESIVVNDTAALTRLVLPRLTEVENVSISRNASLTTVELPRLGRVLATVPFADEAQGEVRGVFMSQNPLLTTVALPLLTRVTADLALYENPSLGLVDVATLNAVDGGFVIRGSQQMQDLEAPRLARAGGLVASDNPALVALSFPALRDVLYQGGIDIAGNASLESVSLPALTGAGGGVSVRVNPVLTELDLPLLQAASTLDLNGLDSLSSFHAPALSYLNGCSVTVNAALTTLELPRLAQAVGGCNVTTNASLQAIRLPLLVSVGPLSVVQNDTLTDIEAPQLLELWGDLLVMGNDQLLTLDLQALSQLTGTATITENNPAVQCLGAPIVDVGDCAP